MLYDTMLSKEVGGNRQNFPRQLLLRARLGIVGGCRLVASTSLAWVFPLFLHILNYNDLNSHISLIFAIQILSPVLLGAWKGRGG